MSEVSEQFQPFLLVSDGQVLQLIQPLPSGEQVLARHILRSAIDPVLHTSEEYGEVVRRWLLKYAIEIVHIRHLAWHSLDLPKDCKKLGIPTVFSFHDYYMVCPSVKLLDERMVSCEGVCTASKGYCKSELWRPSSMPLLKNQYQDVWRRRSASCLAECDAFVTTSDSAKTIILRAFPDIANKLQVVPHGRTFSKFAKTAAVPQRKEPFRVMVAGNISRAKGSALVAAAAAQLRKERVEFYLLGTADDGLVGDDVIKLGPYQRDTFDEHMAKIKPSIGLLPSLWPETYCHVLTEFWAAGIPVLGYDCGAVGERIRAQGGGWLFDEASTDVLTYAIRSIRSDSQDLRDRIQEVLEWQAGPGSSWTAREMGTAYSNLYSSLIDSRRIFA
jgi:glycosyltransferase involved in cell wall biosynthesis